MDTAPSGRHGQEQRQIIQLVGQSQQVMQMRQFAQLAAESDHTVLILGEMGTGKDHLAEYIHSLGKEGSPFVMVDCGSLSTSLTETELFGHIQGAFTDAKTARPGLVRAAENGTLFFNEVANMSLDTQAKFLGIVEKKPFRPVGSTKEMQVNTRIVAATNANLSKMIRQGRFREDLLYRLDCLTWKVPPLREHREDIPLLTEHFVAKWDCSAQFATDAYEMMMAYHWPGNIRQLESVVKKAMLNANYIPEVNAEAVRGYMHVLDEMLDHGGDSAPTTENAFAKTEPTAASPASRFAMPMATIPPFDTNSDQWPALFEVGNRAALAAEAVLIRMAMQHCHYHKGKVAKLLQVNYRTLLNRIRENPDLGDFRDSSED